MKKYAVAAIVIIVILASSVWFNRKVERECGPNGVPVIVAEQFTGCVQSDEPVEEGQVVELLPPVVVTAA